MQYISYLIAFVIIFFSIVIFDSSYIEVVFNIVKVIKDNYSGIESLLNFHI